MPALRKPGWLATLLPTLLFLKTSGGLTGLWTNAQLSQNNPQGICCTLPMISLLALASLPLGKGDRSLGDIIPWALLIRVYEHYGGAPLMWGISDSIPDFLNQNL